MTDVEAHIEKLKALTGTSSNQELADAIGIGRRTIERWRSTKSIPFVTDRRISGRIGLEAAFYGANGPRDAEYEKEKWAKIEASSNDRLRAVEDHIEALRELAEGDGQTDDELEAWLGLEAGSIAKWRSAGDVFRWDDDHIRRLRGPEAAFADKSPLIQTEEENVILYACFAQISRAIQPNGDGWDFGAGKVLLYLEPHLRRIIAEIGLERLRPDEVWLILSNRIDEGLIPEIKEVLASYLKENSDDADEG